MVVTPFIQPLCELPVFRRVAITRPSSHVCSSALFLRFRLFPLSTVWRLGGLPKRKMRGG